MALKAEEFCNDMTPRTEECHFTSNVHLQLAQEVSDDPDDGSRAVIPANLLPQFVGFLRPVHFGMQRILAPTAVYRPDIDDDASEQLSTMNDLCRTSQQPPEPIVHPWMLPERRGVNYIWIMVNFIGSNWLVQTNSYSKYPCIHPTLAITAKAIIDLLRLRTLRLSAHARRTRTMQQHSNQRNSKPDAMITAYRT